MSHLRFACETPANDHIYSLLLHVNRSILESNQLTIRESSFKIIDTGRRLPGVRALSNSGV